MRPAIKTVFSFACPLHHSELQQKEGRLVCGQGHSFPIEAGVPIFAAHPRRELQPRNMPPCAPEPRSHVDPFVNDWIVNTNGNLYWSVRGRLPRYPVPLWPFEPGQGKLLVDLGCGWGRWCVAAARAGYLPLGLDVHLDAVQAAARIAPQLGHECSFACADLDALPFQDAQVGAVFSYSVLQHVEREKVRRALSEIWRILEPGGEVFLQLPNKYGPISLLQQLKRGFREAKPESFEMRYWSPSQIREMALAANFMGVQLNADGFLSQNPQISDVDLLPFHGRLVVRCSQVACKVAAVFPPLTAFADSVWLRARKPQ
jgi:SAM-dependent methyltransferase